MWSLIQNKQYFFKIDRIKNWINLFCEISFIILSFLTEGVIWTYPTRLANYLRTLYTQALYLLFQVMKSQLKELAFYIRRYYVMRNLLIYVPVFAQESAKFTRRDNTYSLFLAVV